MEGSEVAHETSCTATSAGDSLCPGQRRVTRHYGSMWGSATHCSHTDADESKSGTKIEDAKDRTHKATREIMAIWATRWMAGVAI